MTTTTITKSPIVCGEGGCRRDVTATRTLSDDGNHRTLVLECPAHGVLVEEKAKREPVTAFVCGTGMPGQTTIGTIWAPA